MTRGHVLIGAVAVAATGLVVALGAVLIASGGGSSATRDAAHTAPAAVRTLLVSATSAPVSQPGLVLHGRLVAGHMPMAATAGKVLTDEECAPDTMGISHCRNAVRLADGRTIVVRHPHDMGRVPCLTPGEHIRVRPA